jgi:hypothetical protein
VNPPKLFWYNDSDYYDSYEDGLEIEMIRIIGKLLNMSLVIGGGDNMKYHNGTFHIRIGVIVRLIQSRGMSLHGVSSLFGMSGTRRVL